MYAQLINFESYLHKNDIQCLQFLIKYSNFYRFVNSHINYVPVLARTLEIMFTDTSISVN